MKKRKLALLLAAVMTASTVGSVSSVSAAELQEIEMIEITDEGEADDVSGELFADEIAVDEVVVEAAGGEDEFIQDDTIGGDVVIGDDVPAADGIVSDEVFIEDIVVEEESEKTAETEEATEVRETTEDEISVAEIEEASAEEVAALDSAVEEEVSQEGDPTTSADANYTVAEGTGQYNADVNGDVFTFTAPVTGMYRARLNVYERIELYRDGDYDSYGYQSITFRAQANETVELRVNCDPEDYPKYRMTFEKIPALASVTVKQEKEFVAGDSDMSIWQNFSAVLTYEDGNVCSLDSLNQSDFYGYGISVGSVKDVVTGGYVSWDTWQNQPGTYLTEIYIGGISATTSFVVKSANPAEYPAISADTEYEAEVSSYGEYATYSFTPAESGSYYIEMKDDGEWYTRVWDGSKLNSANLSEVTAGTLYVIKICSYDDLKFKFKVVKKSSVNATNSTSGELALNTPVSGYYVSTTGDAEYTFTPSSDGYYTLNFTVTEKAQSDYIRVYLNKVYYYYDEGDYDYDYEEYWSDYSVLSIKRYMYAGTQYKFSVSGSDSIGFSAVVTDRKLADVQVVEKPIQQSVLKGVGVLDCKGMKVLLTYTDGSTETLGAEGTSLVDAQGNRYDNSYISTSVQGNERYEVTVCCGNYYDTFTVPIASPTTSESIQENVQNVVTLPANTNGKILQFTASRTGKYEVEVNGDSDYEDSVYECYAGIYDEKGKKITKLTAGTTYYVKVTAFNIDENYLLQDTSVNVYVGEDGDGCVFVLTSETPATCTTEGQKVYTCTRHVEQETRTEVVPKLDHVKDAGTVTVQATCQQAGTKVYKCSVCGTELYSEAVSKLDHVTDAGTVTVQATCTKTGTKVYKCTLCGTELYKETLSKVDHQKDKGTVTTKATALKEGVKTYKCSVCGTKISTSKIAKLKATIKVTASSLKLKVGQSTTKFKVTGLASGDYVKYWKTNDKSVVTVTGKKTGSCTIKATKKTGSATITIFLASGKTKDIKVTVQKAAVEATKISGVSSKLTVKKGKSVTLKPTLSPFTCVQKVTYTTSNKKVATVSSKGKITGKKKGTATITVKAGKKSVKCKVTVK